MGGRVPRVVILGAPRTGKTTYATKLAKQLGVHLGSTGKRTEQPEGLVSTDNYMRRADWKTLPDVVIKDLRGRESWVLEGTQAARVLRRALKEDPNFLKPGDKVLMFNQPWVQHSPGQASMAKGVRTIVKDIVPLLARIGIEVQHMTPPQLTESERAALRDERMAEAVEADRAEPLQEIGSDSIALEPEMAQDTA